MNTDPDPTAPRRSPMPDGAVPEAAAAGSPLPFDQAPVQPATGPDGLPPRAADDHPQANPAHLLGSASVTPRERALARLAASRGELAAVLIPPPPPRLTGRHAAPGPMSRRIGAWLRYWRWRLNDSPLAGVASDAARDWWYAHPWRPTAELVAEQGRSVALPWVRQHPYLAVGLTATAAAALMAARPWRSPWLAPHVASFPHTARRWAWLQVRRLPVQSILTTAIALWATRQAADARDTAHSAEREAHDAGHDAQRAAQAAPHAQQANQGPLDEQGQAMPSPTPTPSAAPWPDAANDRFAPRPGPGRAAVDDGWVDPQTASLAASVPASVPTADAARSAPPATSRVADAFPATAAAPAPHDGAPAQSRSA
jgi:hypothetical protein